ncbi:hypothetical protein RJ639_021672 [Escallonia herrerae]|uniref:Uncharacterized protein n=1 Tax=Escallonia herrerae TaxID=1293975 RepID=A0AA89AFI5_9ASTE|nr:hypothetical protein RJ639_021672 [Escallonia herrerae]
MFVRPAEELAEELNCRRAGIQVPVIDLGGIQKLDRCKEIVNEIRTAAMKWGFSRWWNTVSLYIHLKGELVSLRGLVCRQDICVQETVVEAALEYDRTKELEAFDETKAGVKGLIDNGLVKIPKIFV